MREFHISEIYADGEQFPVPGPKLRTVHANDAIEALNVYSRVEGFAPYSPIDSNEPDAIKPHVWNADTTIASAPFTNTEIMAYTTAAIS